MAAAFLVASAGASAQTEVLRIELNNGTFQTLKVSDIKEMTFGNEESSVAGVYKGVNTVVVGGTMTYTKDVEVLISENADGTINFTWPQYSLSGTVMGELTLGTVTIPNIPFDESKGGYFLDYSSLGLKQHFTAMNNGNATMDQDYILGDTSTILIETTENEIKVTNPFKLGAMPLPITATFEGNR